MKRCLVCGALADNERRTCVKCGEASWVVVPETVTAAPEPVVIAKPADRSRRRPRVVEE